MRTVRSSRRNSRPGRPVRSSILSAGGGGASLSSAGVPTLTANNTAAGTTSVAINPVNWGGQVGDDIVVVGYYEAFNGTVGSTTVDDWTFAPDEGTVYKLAAGDDGTQTHGCLFVWLINSATTTAAINLNPSHTDATLDNCSAKVLIYRTDTITVGVEAGAWGMDNPVTDVGDWTYGGSSNYTPPDPVAVTDGTNWHVMACAGSGDDGSFQQTATTGLYDNIYPVSITTGADSAVAVYTLEGHASLTMTANHDVINTDWSSTLVSRAFGWLFVGTV